MPVAVAMTIPQELEKCLQHYNDYVMYKYDNEYNGLDCYHGAYILGGDSDKVFSQHH